MSSLRLALKMSMEPPPQAAAAVPEAAGGKPAAPPKRKRSISDANHGKNNSSDESDSGAVVKRPSAKEPKGDKEKEKDKGRDHEGGGKKRSSSSLGTEPKADGGDKPSSSKATSSKSGAAPGKPRSAPKSKSAPKSASASAASKALAETANDADDEADSVVEGGGKKYKDASEADGVDDNKDSANPASSAAASSAAASSAAATASATSALPTTTSAKKRKPKQVHEDDENGDGTGEKEGGQAATPRYQSNRAAAMIAKTKLNSRGPKSPIDEEAFNQTLPGGSSATGTGAGAGAGAGSASTAAAAAAAKAKAAAEQAALQWVACDRCGKWRSLPHHVEMASLPEQWYCSMNLWSDRYNDCSIEEEVLDDYEDESLGEGGGGMEEEDGDDENDDDDDDMMGSDGEGGTGRRKGGYRSGSTPVEKVNWVQCNKCTKWRKVPGVVDVDSLPDVWQCSMNTWAPAFARCTAKEETDDPAEDQAMMRGRGRPSGLPMGNGSQFGGPPVKKVIQWVQCERRNCKKWRKLPGHVDMSLLPEKWYCEMNEWDIERASCEAPEYSDSESELNTFGNEARSQPVQSNAKGGSGTLSYRRIIFGTDGRIRPAYSEKNKNGFGLFSFTDTSRANGDAENDEEGTGHSVEPVRRISYWWSSAYDESGANFLTSQAQHPSAVGVGSYSSQIKREVSRETAAVDVVEEPENKAVEISSLAKDQPAHHLLRAARRLGGIESLYDSVGVYPLKMLKHDRFDDMRTLLEIEKAECAVIRSCLQSSSTLTLSFSALVETLRSSFFHSPHLESCRAKFTLEGVKAAIQRLETQGEVDVTFKRNGELVVHSNALPPQQIDLLTASTAADLTERNTVPLKLRKHQQREAKKRAAEQQEKAAAPPPPPPRAPTPAGAADTTATAASSAPTPDPAPNSAAAAVVA